MVTPVYFPLPSYCEGIIHGPGGEQRQITGSTRLVGVPQHGSIVSLQHTLLEFTYVPDCTFRVSSGLLTFSLWTCHRMASPEADMLELCLRSGVDGPVMATVEVGLSGI